VTLGFRIEWTDASDWRLVPEATVDHGYFDRMHVDDALRKEFVKKGTLITDPLTDKPYGSREITSRDAVLASLAKHS